MNLVSPEAQRLLKAVQDTIFDRLATFTEAAQPPLGSDVRNGHPADSVIALDLIFALDTSGSIGRGNFESIKTFVENIARPLVMNKDATHIAAIAFGSQVYEISKLTSSKPQFLTALSDFTYRDGLTNTSGALLKAKEMFEASPRRVQRLKRVLILVTDGKSNRQPKRPELVADELGSIFVERYAFGIGRFNRTELNAIASPPSDYHVFIVTTFSVFKQFADLLRPSKSVHYQWVKCHLTVFWSA